MKPAGAAIVLVLAITGALALRYPERAVAGLNDFLQLYVGARLVGTPALYSADANKRLEVALTGVSLDGVYYSRLPFYASLLKPLAKLPYRTAYAVYQALSITAFAVFAWLFLTRDRGAALLAGIFFPLIANFLAGQDLAFVLLAAAGTVLLARRKGRDFAAGLLLAFCAIKFHLFVLAPVAFAVWRRWRLFWGAAAGIGLLIAWSYLAAGPAWPREYLGMLLNPELHPGPEHMPNLFGSLKTLGAPAWLQVAAAVVFAAAGVRAIVRSRDFEAAFGVALVGGLLLSFHSYVQDCAILLLAVPLVWRGVSRVPEAALFAMLTPIPYLLLLMGAPFNAVAPGLMGVVLIWLAIC
jgi:hypothetical protein